MRIAENFYHTELESLKKFLYEAQLMGYGGEERRGKVVKADYHFCNPTEDLKSRTIEDWEQQHRNEEEVVIYANGMVKSTMPSGQTRLIYESSDKKFLYADEWAGGEPYAGITNVFYCGVACFAMTYWGEVIPRVEKEVVYPFLKEALQTMDPDHPWRGAKTHRNAEGNLFYSNEWWGKGLEKFNGRELIINKVTDAMLYRMYYHGGLVNLR